ncbi:MAG: hypothetical protein HYT75_02670 [Deltaproteobacteria bacterium]|nr:hypothetical protein [Deltaproteobacteria bacterium]
MTEVDKKYAKAHMSGGFIANAGDVVRFADKSKEVVANSDDDSDGYDVME